MKYEKVTPSSSVLIISGHYGVGKTNLALNVALNAAAEGAEVVLADLDVVNPYFRSSDYQELLEDHGIDLIAPLFAGSTLENPSLSGRIEHAVKWARECSSDSYDERDSESQVVVALDTISQNLSVGRHREEVCKQGSRTRMSRLLVIDAGGDDVGVTALGRFASLIQADSYEMWYVMNRSRNLTQSVDEVRQVLDEIQQKSHLCATSIVNNTHLKAETTYQVIAESIPFARQVADSVGLPLLFTTIPYDLFEEMATSNTGCFFDDGTKQAGYCVQIYVRNPWE